MTLGDKVNRLAELTHQRAELEVEISDLNIQVQQGLQELQGSKGRGRPAGSKNKSNGEAPDPNQLAMPMEQ